MSYPILLDLRGKLVVIVGGGAVAARKLRGLLEAGADRLRVVAPQIDPAIAATGVEVVRETYEAMQIAGAAIVFAATDNSSVNETIVKDARSIGAWVNRADDHGDSDSDFSTPAVHRDGPVIVTASTSGNPALATRIRDAAAASVNPKWVRMARTMAALRPAVRACVDLPRDRRRQIFVWLASDEAMQLLENSGEQALNSELQNRLKVLSLRTSTGLPADGG